MTEQVGTIVLELLERVGQRSLPPDIYRIFLLQIGGSEAVRRYEPNERYWERVQRILDGFFTSAERAEICARLIEHDDLRARPECRRFMTRALAERRLQDLLVDPRLRCSTPAR